MQETFLSVGIDIGTTTTQLIFSKITMENRSRSSSIPETRITGKELLYKSDIYFTPLVSQNQIDVLSLQKIISSEYERSGIKRSDVSTGAVIITGESARKENAEEVVSVLSGFAGDFVVSTAGPDLESVLAGWGSGAGELSKSRTGLIINFDIGGGTTNAAVFFNGEIVDSFALDIGGRLIKLDDSGCISYISERLEPVIQKMGLNIFVGKKAEFAELIRVAERLSEMFIELISQKELAEDANRLFIGHGYKGLRIDNIMFSGGVSEYIYSNEEIDTLEKSAKFKDIGPLLGYYIRQTFSACKMNLLQPREKIRATVVGAGNYSLSVSGNTVTFDNDLLPLKNIPVIKLFGNHEEEDIEIIFERISTKNILYQGETTAIAFRGKRSPGYHEIRRMACQIIDGTKNSNGLLIIIVENDFAKALGQMIRIMLDDGKPVICLDRVRVSDGNYIDIGRQVAGVVPIVVKTLIFNS